MAGLYDLIRRSGRPSDQGRLDIHFLHASLGGFAAGKFSGPQIKATLNSMLTSKGYAELTTDESSDIDKIGVEINAFSAADLDERNQYINIVWASSKAAEIEAHSGMTDSVWRSHLNITAP